MPFVWLLPVHRLGGTAIRYGSANVLRQSQHGGMAVTVEGLY